MNSLTKLYDKLSADERARLFVAAAARRDIQELDRLNETCPRKRYEGEDYDYTRRKINLWILTLAHHGDMSRLEIVAFTALALLVAFENSDDERAGETIEDAENMLHKALSAWNAKAEAWRQFCEGIGIDPDIPRRAFGCEPNPLWSVVSSVVEGLEITTAEDRAASEIALNNLKALWERGGP